MNRYFRSAVFAFLAVASAAAAALSENRSWIDKLFDGETVDIADSVKTGQQPQKPAVEDLDDRVWVVVKASDAGQRSRVADAGVAIEEIGAAAVAGIATKEDVARLKAAGLTVEREVDLSSLKRFFLKDFPQQDADYFNYREVQSELDAAVAAAPELVSKLTIGKSVDGRDISGVRFNTDAKGDEPSSKPGIVFLGTHHAREHLSTMVPTLMARWLAANRAKPEVAKLLQARDIYFFPLINPDGAEFDIATGQYKWHRKNMRRNANGTTGVDLNRNYGYGWGGGGASPDPGSDTYRGPSAFSEPESQAVKRFVEARPNLKILLSYHTFSELILYPWGHTNSPIPDARALAAYKAMAQKMAGMTGYTPQQSSQLYIASGDTTDWAWGEKKIFAFTFELTPKNMTGGGFYPGARAIQSTFQKNINPALYLIDLADDPYRAAGRPSAAAGAARPAFRAPLSAPVRR